MPKELLDHAGYYGSLTVYQVELSDAGLIEPEVPLRVPAELDVGAVPAAGAGDLGAPAERP